MSDRTTSWRERLAHVPRRTRRVGAAGAALIIIGAGVTWALSGRHAVQGAPGGTTRPAAVETTAGRDMGGMNMGGMATSTGGAVHLTANQIRQFGITFGTAEMRRLEARVRTVGTVAVDESRIAQVAPRFGGFVERLHVDATGQPVRRGQPLMDVYSPELLAAEQELLVARNLERSIGESTVPGVPAGAPDLVAAAKRRLQLWDISEAQIEAILRTGEPRRTLTLYAPASGIVLEKNVVQGQAIQSGQMLYTIASLDDVWVEAALREQDAGAVRIGSAASVALAAFPGRSVRGRVTYVYPTLDSIARTIRARIEVPNPDGRLKPGMYATVELTTPTRTALTVPASSVVNTGERAVVFVELGDGALVPREVVVGRVAGDYAEVLSGLEPGQRVVTSAQFLLDSESNLAEVMKSMIGQMSMSDMNSTGRMPDMSGMNVPGGDRAGVNAKGAPMTNMPGMPMPADTSRR
ncbi:MAG TPA: efflux RND transporter periplasmic adaptor subunit [Gemmatimonadaceae bacterium]